MAVDTRQAQELLGTGLSNEVVATALGCTPSYITQLMADPDFSAVVIAQRTLSLTANSARDKTIDAIEDTLLTKITECLDNGLIYRPADVLRTFAVVNKATRRGIPASESLTINQTVVNLNLPEKVVQTFTQNAQGEVVEVEGRTLVTMPAHVLLSNLVKQNQEGGNDVNSATYEKVSRYLPTTIESQAAALEAGISREQESSDVVGRVELGQNYDPGDWKKQLASHLPHMRNRVASKG